MAEVRFNSTLRLRFGRAHTVSLTEPTTVREIFLALAENMPGLSKALFAAEDQLDANVIVFRNGRKIVFLDGLDTVVQSDDTLNLFPRSGSHQVADNR